MSEEVGHGDEAAADDAGGDFGDASGGGRVSGGWDEGGWGSSRPHGDGEEVVGFVGASGACDAGDEVHDA